MEEIATYVFLDLGTTLIKDRNLREAEVRKLKITEIAMVALERSDISSGTFNEIWSRMNKFTMCINPGKLEEHELKTNAKLNNESLKFETLFDENVLHTIDLFLKCQKQPVCLIAHNGHKYDFIILSEHLKETNPCWLQNIMCADSIHAFHDIIQGRCKNPLAMKNQNELTPNKQKRTKRNLGPKPLHELKRTHYWKPGVRPQDDNGDYISYKLPEIYKCELGELWIVPHPAENDCILIAEIFIHMGDECIEWFDNHYCHFLDHINQTGLPTRTRLF